MTDFASLQVKIDSTQVKPAVDQLNRLTDAGRKTEEAVGNIGSAARKGAEGLHTIGTAGNNARIAQMELMHVVTASSDAFAAGIPIQRIFATEIGRVAQAASFMSSGLGGVAGFLSGPWGIAITSAVAVLGSLAAAHFTAADASEKHKDAAAELEKAMQSLHDATVRASKSTEQLAVDDITAANSAQALTIETRKKTIALLESAKASRSANLIAAEGLGELGRPSLNIKQAADAERQMADLTKQIAEQNAKIAREGETIRLKRGEIIQKNVAAEFDKGAAATLVYDRALGKLNDQLKTGKISEGQYADGVRSATKAREDATEKTKKSSEAHRAHAAALTDGQRAYNRQIDETDRYIESLAIEVAQIGKTPEQIKQMEIARQRETAQIERQRKSLDQLIISRAIELANQDREKKAKDWQTIRFDVEAAILEEQKKNEEALQRVREQNIQTLADFYETAFHDGAKGIWKDFKNQGLRIIAEIAAAYTLAMINGQQTSLGGILSQINVGGGQFGLPGMLLSSLLGGNRSGSGAGGGLSLGAGTVGDFLGGGGGGVGESAGILSSINSPIGGGLGSFGSALPQAGLFLAATQVSNLLGGGIAKLLGINYDKKLGSIFGVLGGVIGGLFKKTKKGSATLGIDDFGVLGVGSTSGNSASRIGSSKTAIGSVADALAQIADQLGGTITGAGSVSIGIRKKSYRVDTTGKGRTKGSGVLDFGQDAEAAVRAAIADALADGVIAGISDASKRILASGQKLETAIEKASLIEQIPKLLKQRLDPLGAALDDLNKQWDKVWAALKEGQATTEQYAQAQQLYNLELQDVKDNTKGASSALKDFIDSLNFGSNSPYSLMDQETAAKSKLQPFLDQIATGGTVDQQKYLDTAQSFLDIERQLYGSTPQFFDALNLVKDSTNHLIDKIDNVTSIGTDAIAQATADNTAQTASNTAAIGDMTSEQTALLQDNNNWLAVIAAKLNASGQDSSFIGNATGFASAA